MSIFDTNPELKKHIIRALRERGWQTNRAAYRRLKEVDFSINERQWYAEQIAKHREGDQIALIRDGMDCDCTQYLRVTHIDVPHLFAWHRSERKHQEWLDGPETSYFGRPSEYPQRHKQSDRALEAYEDGHPSYVTKTSLWD